jgi:sugar O-acyltransferase (sialic acid O-acetyltransferase NeuD family)
MKRLVIFGAGDIAQLAKFYFESDSCYSVEAFTVDGQFFQESFEGKPVVAFDEVSRIFPPSRFELFIALSYRNLNSIRAAKYHAARKMGYTLASYVSSRCSYLSQFSPGDNCFILENNIVQPFVKIGNNVTLWSGNHIGHHSIIEDHNFVSSHVVISGHCIIESNCFLGVNATVHNNVHINRENLIGAGAIITKSTKEGEVYLAPKSAVFVKKSSQMNF